MNVLWVTGSTSLRQLGRTQGLVQARCGLVGLSTAALRVDTGHRPRLLQSSAFAPSPVLCAKKRSTSRVNRTRSLRVQPRFSQPPHPDSVRSQPPPPSTNPSTPARPSPASNSPLERPPPIPLSRPAPSPLYAGRPQPPLRPLSPFLDQARQTAGGDRFSSDHTWVIFTFIGLNAVVFAAWSYAVHEARQRQDIAPYLFMRRNFTSGELNLGAGRWWTLVTSCISHEDTAHFAMNMVSFFFMAPPVLALVGPMTFTGLYFGAGIISSTISIAWRKYMNPWINRTPKDFAGKPLVATSSHGASGSIYAVMSAFACLMPRTTFLLFFVVPMPAWVVVPGILSYDLYSAWFTPAGREDSAGHLGGALAGILFWRFRLRGLRFK